MHTIALKTIIIDDGKITDGKLDYKQLLLTVVERPIGGQGGVSVKEMREAMRVVNRLNDAENEVKLEDADFNFLLTRLNAFPFAISHQAILDMVDEIQNSPVE